MLSPKQHLFLAAMLEEQTIEAAWKRVGISSKTAYKYLEDPEFKQELQKSRRKVVDGISNRLRQLGSEAIETLRGNLTDEEATPATKNSTAKIILEFIYRSHELENVTERIDEMERKLEETES